MIINTKGVRFPEIRPASSGKALPLFLCWLCLLIAAGRFSRAETVYKPPASPNATYSFNPDWKFIRQDVPGAEQPDFDDSAWATVSAPHTYNDVDTFDEFISHGTGERHEYMGIAWYRKRFKLPEGAKDGKVFLQFDGLKQAARFWVNGKYAGKYENGVTACGLDITNFVNFGGTGNIIAVKVDNSNNYVEAATGVGYEWMRRDFNPNYGGLNHDIWLVVTGKIYQTLPLYENLKTTGTYVYPSNFILSGKACDVTVESQVRNEAAGSHSAALSVVVVDAHGMVQARFQSGAGALAVGETRTFTATGRLSNARFWDVDDPYLYDVYSIVTVDGKVADVRKIPAGFRAAAFKGGAGTGGVWLNGRFVYLTGFSQRVTNEWAGLGQAYPDWMHDENAAMVRGTNANYIRWMHIAPQRADVSACDRYGIIEICPAGDKEKDVQGRQWEQRLEVMRDTMIFYRNDPSILFWEAGNNGITADHMQQMADLHKQWDPGGGRAIGCRTLTDPAATPIPQYYGVMVGQDTRTDKLTGYTKMFRAYSAERRDRAPLIENEDFRDEASRRFWDDFSPPHFGFKPGPKDIYHRNSETFCLAAAVRYHEYFLNRISNTDPAHAKWSGYASIFWSDSNSDGRQNSSEVCRVGGKVDAVRLPKQAYYVYRVMQNPAPDIHLIGHWTYPAKTVKTVYVAANHCDSVTLFVNGKPAGAANTPCDFVDPFDGKNNGNTGYIYAFPNVKFEPGVIRAVGVVKGKAATQDELKTAGPPKRIRLTVHTGPNGLQADGSDVALIDFEVVDADGERCPTDEARVDFKLDGPAIWRGGYNSGIPGSINQLFLNTECGINRVAIRATLLAGSITLTATRPGLESATVRIESKSVAIQDGLVPMR